jgi:hypothetical protein
LKLAKILKVTIFENQLMHIGLFSLTNDPDTTVLACPAKDIGHVAVHCYGIEKRSIIFLRY